TLACGTQPQNSAEPLCSLWVRKPDSAAGGYRSKWLGARWTPSAATAPATASERTMTTITAVRDGPSLIARAGLGHANPANLRRDRERLEGSSQSNQRTDRHDDPAGCALHTRARLDGLLDREGQRDQGDGPDDHEPDQGH